MLWRQADATDLPFEADSFDAVLCQQGLQFVPNKSAAVEQMRRVLRPGGVAAVSVWCAPESNPYISALAAGLSRHLSSEAGDVMLAPCGLADGDVLASLFVEAGFSNVNVEKIEQFRDPIHGLDAIKGNLASLPIAAQIDAMEPADQSSMFDDIISMLDEFINDGLLRHPMSANIVIAA